MGRETRTCIWLGRHYMTLEGSGEGNSCKGKLGRFCGRARLPSDAYLRQPQCTLENVTPDAIKMAKCKGCCPLRISERVFTRISFVKLLREF